MVALNFYNPFLCGASSGTQRLQFFSQRFNLFFWQLQPRYYANAFALAPLSFPADANDAIGGSALRSRFALALAQALTAMCAVVSTGGVDES